MLQVRWTPNNKWQKSLRSDTFATLIRVRFCEPDKENIRVKTCVNSWAKSPVWSNGPRYFRRKQCVIPRAFRLELIIMTYLYWKVKPPWIDMCSVNGICVGLGVWNEECSGVLSIIAGCLQRSFGWGPASRWAGQPASEDPGQQRSWMCPSCGEDGAGGRIAVPTVTRRRSEPHCTPNWQPWFKLNFSFDHMPLFAKNNIGIPFMFLSVLSTMNNGVGWGEGVTYTVRYCYKMFHYRMILYAPLQWQSEFEPQFELITDSPYIALTDEISNAGC